MRGDRLSHSSVSFFFLLNFSCPCGGKWYLVVLICVFIMTSDVDNLCIFFGGGPLAIFSLGCLFVVECEFKKTYFTY